MPRGGASPRCSVDNCKRTHVARGWCGTHYKRWVDTGDVRPDEPIQTKYNKVDSYEEECSVDGCSGSHSARGLCRHHYYKARRHRHKLMLVANAGGCERCGTPSRHLQVYEFHHIKRSDDNSKVSNKLASSWGSVLGEARKCLVLCANCHNVADAATEEALRQVQEDGSSS